MEGGGGRGGGGGGRRDIGHLMSKETSGHRLTLGWSHRRGIKTEEKAKVVAAVWGREFIQFHAALQIYQQDDLKKRMNRIKATWRN